MEGDAAYTERLIGSWWKPTFLVQAPYRWNIRRLDLGYTLDVGCGIGRNLLHLDGNGVGVDTNAHSIAVARERGLTAYTTDEFLLSPDAAPASFDSLLFAHVLEHMTNREAEALVGDYLGYLKPAGKVVIIVPQEAGFASDPTHVDFLDDTSIGVIHRQYGLETISTASFPFPRGVGKVFKHNETVVVARRR